MVEMDLMRKDQVAEILGQTTVFVALGLSESFGLPVAEALSAGCYVVGYDGGGGYALFEAPGALRIPDQRPALLVDAIFRILADPTALAAAECNRMWLHSRYHRDRTRQALEAAVNLARDGPSRPATAIHPWPRVAEIGARSFPVSG